MVKCYKKKNRSFYTGFYMGLVILACLTVDDLLLLVADDTLTFMGTNLSHLHSSRAFSYVVKLFLVKNEFGKVRAGSCGQVSNVDGLVSILGCKVSYLPTNILTSLFGSLFQD